MATRTVIWYLRCSLNGPGPECGPSSCGRADHHHQILLIYSICLSVYIYLGLWLSFSTYIDNDGRWMSLEIPWNLVLYVKHRQFAWLSRCENVVFSCLFMNDSSTEIQIQNNETILSVSVIPYDSRCAHDNYVSICNAYHFVACVNAIYRNISILCLQSFAHQAKVCKEIWHYILKKRKQTQKKTIF